MNVLQVIGATVFVMLLFGTGFITGWNWRNNELTPKQKSEPIGDIEMEDGEWIRLE